MRRGTAAALAALMMVFGALPGLARDGATDDRVVGDREVVDVVDRPVDRETEPSDHARSIDPVPVDIVDRPSDRPVDRVRDRETDRVRDRETDRYRCVDFVTDRRCIDDRHPHVNIRHLIQRLINAGEWEKLFRLLHRLGIV